MTKNTSDTVNDHSDEQEVNVPVSDINEPRLFEEIGVEARVNAVIAPVLKPLGYRIVRINLSGLNGLTLQIMAERADGTMTIDDCEIVSRTVSPVLDVEDVIERKYHLEVSSPGIDRALVRKSDFVNWRGHIAKVETSEMVDGRRKFRGHIESVDGDGFTIRTDKAAYGEALSVKIGFNLLSDARLILTDDLIRDALRKDKALRQSLIPEDELGGDDVQDNENADGKDVSKQS
ncbi:MULTISPECIES: ribosome maturation factor RimP [unclassified Bartonella]|uniref:ribosome maturation factor RimP n=1 Tax=unclassified Bartonella TaxID=2645622 RepID=UPI0015FC6500|nr:MULTISPECIES: ribosome maturation factor RimP [unclassified Bartonella]UXN02585.1 ribosome maturation factor RimP [Bartonella sp. HY406]UXN05556.1 ribosome maturation factor RimP [Bartonella sp. HY761]